MIKYKPKEHYIKRLNCEWSPPTIKVKVLTFGYSIMWFNVPIGITVKGLIERVGIPSNLSVGVKVNGLDVDFDKMLSNNDSIVFVPMRR